VVYDLAAMPIDSDEERRRLEQMYASMPLAQLQKIASHPMFLTDIAHRTIQAELRRRGVGTATPAQPEGPRGDDMSDANLVEVCRFRDVPEAQLAKGTLDSAGIESVLADENTIQMDWLWSNALGGVKLLVRAEDAGEAARLLNQPIPEHLEVPGVGDY